MNTGKAKCREREWGLRVERERESGIRGGERVELRGGGRAYNEVGQEWEEMVIGVVREELGMP